jgi:hypothetical protein
MKRDPTDELIRSLAKAVPPPAVGEAERLRRAIGESQLRPGFFASWRQRWVLLPLATGLAAALLLIGQPITVMEQPLWGVAPQSEDQDLASFVDDAYEGLEADQAEADEVFYFAELDLR